MGDSVLPTSAPVVPFLEEAPEDRATLAEPAGGGRRDIGLLGRILSSCRSPCELDFVRGQEGYGLVAIGILLLRLVLRQRRQVEYQLSP